MYTNMVLTVQHLKTNKDGDRDAFRPAKSASRNTPEIINGTNSAKVLKNDKKVKKKTKQNTKIRTVSELGTV